MGTPAAVHAARITNGRDACDKSKGQPLTPGGFFSAPPRMSHFAWATGETVVEVTAMGPLDFRYVDPKDDPSMKPKAK